MPQLANVTFINDSSEQHVYTIVDTVLGQPAVDPQNGPIQNRPMAPNESVVATLVLGENGHGQANYGYKGGVTTTRDDLDDGATVNMD